MNIKSLIAKHNPVLNEMFVTYLPVKEFQYVITQKGIFLYFDKWRKHHDTYLTKIKPWLKQNSIPYYKENFIKHTVIIQIPYLT